VIFTEKYSSFEFINLDERVRGKELCFYLNLVLGFIVFLLTGSRDFSSCFYIIPIVSGFQVDIVFISLLLYSATFHIPPIMTLADVETIQSLKYVDYLIFLYWICMISKKIELYVFDDDTPRSVPMRVTAKYQRYSHYILML
jgi:hypothetical protein